MTIMIDKTKDGYRLTAHENGHMVAAGADKTVPQAAAWLVKNINRLVADVENAVIEAGFLTEAQCTDAAEYGAEHLK